MNPAAYHAHPALSATRLKRALTGTARRFHVPVERTDAMRQGSLIDCLALTPGLFEHRYIVAPEGLDRRTKDGKAAYEAVIASGKIPLNQEQWDNITGAAAAVHAHPAAAPLLNGIQTEVSCFDSWNGVKVKARIDGLGKDYIIDVKTTQDASPASFGKSCAQFRYHVQAAWYQRMTGVNRFIFIAVEKEAPYGVACYELDQQAIDLGHSIIEEQLRTFVECQQLNSWPCYSSTIQSLSLPAWAARQSE